MRLNLLSIIDTDYLGQKPARAGVWIYADLSEYQIKSCVLRRKANIHRQGQRRAYVNRRAIDRCNDRFVAIEDG